MSLGIYRKIINPLSINFDQLRFYLTYRIFGFNNALLFFKRLKKESVIPVLRSYGASIGSNCDIETGLTFHNCSTFSNMQIGNNCHIGKDCFFDLKDKIIIGNNTTISMRCIILTHQDKGKSHNSLYFANYSAPTQIGSNCFIGANSTILAGSQIDQAVIIGAHALIKNHLTAHKRYAGVPVKELFSKPKS